MLESIDTEVLIVGAGPTGLVLALWLTHAGVRVRIVDRQISPAQQSRALAVQARTLELYRQLDLTETVLREGVSVPALNLWVKGRRRARVSLTELKSSLCAYGPLALPQDRHEQLLAARLESLGIRIERGVELLDFEAQDDSVVARLRLADGREERWRACYLAGCDGASSRVRTHLGIGFPGGTYEQLFYVADIQGKGSAIDGELHLDLDSADFLAVFPIDGPGRARLIGTVRDARAEQPETLRFTDVGERVLRQMQIEQVRLNWFSTYRVHHRVAEHFRRGRIFLLGDAAHIHSPAGGQGMNTGIGDAVNLAWKLAAPLRNRALPAALLDSYELERQGFARRLVASTDRGFTLATAQGAVARFARTRLLPRVVSAVFRLPAVRRYVFRTISQLSLNYRHGTLSEGRAGRVHGGDRLPWIPMATGDNFAPLRGLDWQVHVYGRAEAELRRFCLSHVLELCVYPWRAECASAGLARDAMYLLRPDGYVALAHPRQTAMRLQEYLIRVGAITPLSAIPARSR